MKQSINYNHWRSGKGVIRPLDHSESKTNLVCPFDKTFLISYHDGFNEDFYCPNCGIDYSESGKTQYEIEDFIRNYFKTLKSRFHELKEDRQDLGLMLESAKTKRLID